MLVRAGVRPSADPVEVCTFRCWLDKELRGLEERVVDAFEAASTRAGKFSKKPGVFDEDDEKFVVPPAPPTVATHIAATPIVATPIVATLAYEAAYVEHEVDSTWAEEAAPAALPKQEVHNAWVQALCKPVTMRQSSDYDSVMASKDANELEEALTCASEGFHTWEESYDDNFDKKLESEQRKSVNRHLLEQVEKRWQANNFVLREEDQETTAEHTDVGDQHEKSEDQKESSGDQHQAFGVQHQASLSAKDDHEEKEAAVFSPRLLEPRSRRSPPPHSSAQDDLAMMPRTSAGIDIDRQVSNFSTRSRPELAGLMEPVPRLEPSPRPSPAPREAKYVEGSFSIGQFDDDHRLSPLQRWERVTSFLLRSSRTFRVRDCWADAQGNRFLMWNRSRMRTITTRQSCDTEDQGEEIGDIVEVTWNQMVDYRTTDHRRTSQYGRSLPRRTSQYGLSLGPLGRSSASVPVFWRTGSKVVDPCSTGFLLWVSISVFCLLFDIFIMTMEVFGFPTKHFVMHCIEAATAVYWFFDLLLNFKTGYYKDVELVTSTWAIARKYLRGWFLIDFACFFLQSASLVLDLYGQETSISVYWRSVRYVRVFRLVKLDQVKNRLLVTVNNFFVALSCKASAYVVWILLWVHLSATAWYWIGMRSEEGWARRLGGLERLPENYAVSVQWAMSQFQGNTDIHAGIHVAEERAFAACHLLLSLIGLAAFVSKLTTAMQAIEVAHAKMNREVNLARSYCDAHQISTLLSVKVTQYIEWKQQVSHMGKEQEGDLMAILPSDLRRSLLDEVRSPLLVNHVVFLAFKNSHWRFFRCLCADALTSESYLPGVNIFGFGVLCERMYFITHGECQYLHFSPLLQALTQQNGRIKNTNRTGPDTDVRENLFNHFKPRNLHRGSSLCESMLWTRWVHAGDCSTGTHASLLALEYQRFEDLITSYPSVHDDMRFHSERYITAMNHWKADVDDTLTSRDVMVHINFLDIGDSISFSTPLGTGTDRGLDDGSSQESFPLETQLPTVPASETSNEKSYA